MSKYKLNLEVDGETVDWRQAVVDQLATLGETRMEPLSHKIAERIAPFVPHSVRFAVINLEWERVCKPVDRPSLYDLEVDDLLTYVVEDRHAHTEEHGIVAWVAARLGRPVRM